MLMRMLEHGLRAQIRSANLLTGQQYVALEFSPDAAGSGGCGHEPMIVPTMPGSFDQLQQQISSIVNKVEKIPFDDIGAELRDSLAVLTKVLRQVNGELAPQAKAMLRSAEKSLGSVDALLGQETAPGANLADTVRELGQAARSLRALADYLQTNPSSVIRGRTADPAFITP